jgi:hypothetical protein
VSSMRTTHGSTTLIAIALADTALHREMAKRVRSALRALHVSLLWVKRTRAGRSVTWVR